VNRRALIKSVIKSFQTPAKLLAEQSKPTTDLVKNPISFEALPLCARSG
jgi:hypothetical protein